MSETLFISDTHFGHDRILSPGMRLRRPFASIEEDDGSLIARWNAVVDPRDTVWHLGDFSCRCSEDYARTVLGRLPRDPSSTDVYLAPSRGGWMAHSSDNLEMTFTHRSSWKGHIWSRGNVIDTVPISWTKGWVIDKASKTIFLEVWFQKEEELEAAMNAEEPFKVAVGVANDYDAFPHSFREYRGSFLAQPTGERISKISIQTQVLKRVRG